MPDLSKETMTGSVEPGADDEESEKSEESETTEEPESASEE